MQCIACDEPRELHTEQELQECSEMGAQMWESNPHYILTLTQGFGED